MCGVRLGTLLALIIVGLVALRAQEVLRAVYRNRTFLVVLPGAIGLPIDNTQLAACLPEYGRRIDNRRSSLRRVQIAIALCNWTEAESALDGLPAGSVEVRMARAILGRAYLNLGNIDKSIGHWLEARAMSHLVSSGQAAYDTGEQKSAVQLLQACRSVWREWGLQSEAGQQYARRALVLLAEIWRDKGSHILAAGAYEDLVQLSSPNLNAYLNPGEMYYRAGDYESAKHWFKVAQAFNPSAWKPYYKLGLIARQEGRHKVAIGHYLASIGKNGNQAAVWYYLGEAYERDGKVDLARQAYGQALRISPDNAPARRALERLSELP